MGLGTTIQTFQIISLTGISLCCVLSLACAREATPMQWWEDTRVFRPTLWILQFLQISDRKAPTFRPLTEIRSTQSLCGRAEKQNVHASPVNKNASDHVFVIEPRPRLDRELRMLCELYYYSTCVCSILFQAFLRPL